MANENAWVHVDAYTGRAVMSESRGWLARLLASQATFALAP